MLHTKPTGMSMRMNSSLRVSRTLRDYSCSGLSSQRNAPWIEFCMEDFCFYSGIVHHNLHDTFVCADLYDGEAN